MSKIKIHYEEANFLTAEDAYCKNQVVLAQAVENYNTIIGTELRKDSEQDFQKDIYNNTIEDIRNKYRDAHKLGISIEKLCELFDIDLFKIKELSNKYTPDLKEPKEADFILYAETPAQLKRLDNCKKLIDAWSELTKDVQPQMLLPPNPFVNYENSNRDNPLVAKYNYILNGV